MTFFEEGLEDSQLLALIRGSEWSGIDAPFGWPDPFVSALREYSDDGRFPSLRGSDLAFRVTDVHVRERTGIIPLSVSSDRIARAAWRCAGLLTAFGEGRAPDRAGEAGIVEVYPAAALALWGFSFRGYKRGTLAGRVERAGVRAALVASIAKRSADWLDLSPEASRACEESDDILDAFVAALIARAAALRLTEAPRPSQRLRASREGWIHLPAPEGFDRLAKDSPPG